MEHYVIHYFNWLIITTPQRFLYFAGLIHFYIFTSSKEFSIKKKEKVFFIVKIILLGIEKKKRPFKRKE